MDDLCRKGGGGKERGGDVVYEVGDGNGSGEMRRVKVYV